MNEETKDFVIKDRRIFSQDTQEPKEDEVKEKPSEDSAEDTSVETAAKEDAAKQEEPKDEAVGADEPLPEINFATFIFSLNSSALVHLGVIEDPASGQKRKSLSLAKQTIDILGMMEEKTRGNLDEDEEKLLKNILHDLRLMYVREQG